MTNTGSSRFRDPLAPIDVRAEREVSRIDRQKQRRNPFVREEEVAESFLADEARAIEAGLFLIRTEVGGSGPVAEVRSDKREGAFQLQVPNGRYIVGLESFSPSPLCLQLVTGPQGLRSTDVFLLSYLCG